MSDLQSEIPQVEDSSKTKTPVSVCRIRIYIKKK